LHEAEGASEGGDTFDLESFVSGSGTRLPPTNAWTAKRWRHRNPPMAVSRLRRPWGQRPPLRNRFSARRPRRAFRIRRFPRPGGAPGEAASTSPNPIPSAFPPLTRRLG
jgi:hypothetical protein